MTPILRRGVALLALLWMGAAAAAPLRSAEADQATPPAGAAADHALVERIQQETGATREPPAPSVAAYLVDLARVFLGWLAARLLHVRDWVAAGLVALRLAILLLGVAILAVLVWLVRAILRARAARSRGTAGAVRSVRSEEPAGPPPDRQGWAAEMERRLAGQDIAGALEALWWWFACSLCAASVDPAWTSREVLLRAGRPDLSPLIVDLDVMIYGPRSPVPSDVRGLFTRLQEALP